MMNSGSSEGPSSFNIGRGTVTGSISIGNTARRQENQFVIAKCKRNGDDGTEQGESSNQEAEESEAEDRILVVYWRAGKLGGAYFTVQTGELFILEEIVDRPPAHQMFLNLYRRVEPVQVLVDGKMQGSFIACVKQTLFQGEGEGRCKLVFIKAKDYSFEACKRRIYTLSLPSEPRGCSEDDRVMYLRTVVNFAQTQSVHALGALLRYVDLNWSNFSLELNSKPQFISLRKISLADIVTIDDDTYKGLQIFTTVSHPSSFKKGVQGSNKEGLSLYNIFNMCCSKVGQSWMRVLLQHPTNDMAVLTSRQDVVEFFIKGVNDSTMRNICSSLRYIKKVNGILAKIKALSAKPYQWKSLYNTLYNAVLICEICENVKGVEILEKLGSCDNNKLYEMALYMNRIIDFETSKTEGKFTVKPGVDPELDRKKQTMASLHGLMSETAKVELERLPTFVEECAMIYMPHLGYLLAVKAWKDTLESSDKDLPNMRFMFQNNDYIHYKSKGCEELDVMIGDTYPEIVAHETKIMMRLTTVILEGLDTLASVIDQCAILDCLIAISKVSRELNFVRPILTLEKSIIIKQGRHPLHMTSCDSFIPNDYLSNEGEGVVKVLTGPNASGKSVYMKQVGIIAYLAHIGSFVPAESATIGLLSNIYTRIQSTECVANHMSAFLIDLRQMSLALQESTSNSLIIIDEFGKGTSEVDGIALLASCINTLLYREADCPHVLLATHMLQLPEYIVDTELIRYQRFSYMATPDGSPVFLFKLESGRSKGALAARVAAANGLSTAIADRAARITDYYKKNELPPPNKKITAKLNAFVELMKTEILQDE